MDGRKNKKGNFGDSFFLTPVSWLIVFVVIIKQGFFNFSYPYSKIVEGLLLLIFALNILFRNIEYRSKTKK